GAQQVTPSTKVGFCLEDTELYPGFATPGAQTYVYSLIEFCAEGRPDATTVVMGVTEGWRDVYPWTANLQWIDVTDIAPGEYWIAVETDPEDIVTEIDDVNPVVFNGESTIVPGYEPLASAATAAGGPVEITLGARRWDSLVTGAPAVGVAVYTIVQGPAHGTLDVQIGVPLSGDTITYTPDPGYLGPDAIVFEVRDTTSPFPSVAPTATVTIDLAG
ncbi:MAG TPA: lysyl oxidase family protein, partial [Acidimicrobiia bacterium]|nr:lysyl oxidase family protein [Acidimicrobiia bacterium]